MTRKPKMWIDLCGLQWHTVLSHGAIAQLGERLHGMQEVTGSIPVSSTVSYVHKSTRVQKTPQ